MGRALIVGSGPAAAAVAVALAQETDQDITIIDIGETLEPHLDRAVQRMGATGPDGWDAADVAAVRAQPVGNRTRTKGLPQKRSFGSSYPFDDVGQLADVHPEGRANPHVISGAYGGLSNVWGAQVMPFSPATFADWPFDFARLRPHYQAMLGTIPFAAEEDALAVQFPLLVPAQPLPALAPRTEAVLRRAERRQADLDRHGMTVGRARLAFEADSCVRCGLCMTGCPYRLIYSAAQTIDRLRAAGRVRYHEGLLALAIGQEGTTPFVVVRELRSGKTERIAADRLFVGCGAVGTTRLVLDSLRLYEQDVAMAESAQFVLPMLSRLPVPDPRQNASFTLNQFNLVVSTGGGDRDISQIHFYPYSDAVAEALPAPLKTRAASKAATALLRRLTIGLGYLPSWESPVMRVRLRASRRSGFPSGLDVSGDEQPALANHMFRDVMRRMVRAAPMLDLWPVVPQAFLSAPGKSYHFGGSLPHRRSAVDGPLTTDTHGRLRCWPAIHLVDASVFPTVPATTFTLTIMANAHRIARESLALAVRETVAA